MKRKIKTQEHAGNVEHYERINLRLKETNE